MTRWVPWARRPAAADEGESTSVKQHNTVSDLTSSSCYTEYVFERFSSPHNKWHIPSNFIEMLRNGSLNAYCLPGCVTHDEFTYQHQVYQLLHYRPFALKKKKGKPRGCQLPSLQLTLGLLRSAFLPPASSTPGFPGGLAVRNPPAKARRLKRCSFNPWVGKIPWRRK